MGSTFVDFRGKGFEASDSALEVWLALLVQAIDNNAAPAPDWLREIRAEWDLQSTAGFGFGVMPELDRFLTDDQRRDIVLELSRQALKKLDSYGETIPCEDLNALHTGGPGATFTGAASAESFRRTARYFIELLQGTLGPEQIDARFEPGTDPG